MSVTSAEQLETQDEEAKIVQYENAGIHWPRTISEAYQKPHGIYTLENADTLLQEEPIELYNGWLVWQALTDFEERRIADIIQVILDLAARAVGFGQAYPDQVECEMANGDVIKPDVCVVSEERANQGLKITGPNERQVLIGGPELVVELRSPSNTRKDERKKRQKYFENGTLVVWDIDPKQHKLWVWKAENPAQAQLFQEGDTITCPEILPGWQRAVSDLFAKKLSTEAMVGQEAQKWRAESRAEGLEQGRAEGEAEGLRKAVFLQAQIRFGPQLPADLETTLGRYDAAQLMALLMALATSATLADWTAKFPE